VFSVLMIVTVVVGNHYRGQQTFVPVPPGSNRGETEVKLRFPTQPGSVNESPFEEPELGEPGQRSGQPRGYLASLQEPAEEELGPLTWEAVVDNIHRFLAAGYGSIDYNVLMIFLGLFIVIDNLSYTGIPRTIWNAIDPNIQEAIREWDIHHYAKTVKHIHKVTTRQYSSYKLPGIGMTGIIVTGHELLD
jgi:hypothetical protein